VWYLLLEWPLHCIERRSLEVPLRWNIHPFGKHPQIGSIDPSLERFMKAGPAQYRSAPRKCRVQLGTRIVDAEEEKARVATQAVMSNTDKAQGPIAKKAATRNAY